MSRLMLRLVETVGVTPAGSVGSVPVEGPDDIDAVRRWCDATGNAVLTVFPDRVEVFRGRIVDPIAALPANRRPGSRLWVYSNFHCNLACDYCCVSSSPTAASRVFPVDEFSDVVHEAKAAGASEVFITGGEPFMLADLDERIDIATSALPTTVLTNAMLFRGERLRRLDSLSRHRLTLQISLDSPTAELHDRHRGRGSFERALAGIRCAMTLGFDIRVAATLGSDAGGTEQQLHVLFDSLELTDEQRIIRRVARQGSANAGLTISRQSLIPEVCVTVDGVYWHPVAATDPAMKVADHWAPFAEVVERVRSEYRSYRIRGDVLASTFPCG